MAREAAYKIYLYPCDEQETTLVKLLQARHQLAQLCGFPSYPHRSLRGSLAEKPEMVMEFLDSLTAELKPRAARDYNTMRDLKKRTNYTSKVKNIFFRCLKCKKKIIIFSRNWLCGTRLISLDWPVGR